jgi:hypothetical protein
MSARIGMPLGHLHGPSGRSTASTVPSTPLPNISSYFTSIFVAIDSTWGQEVGESLNASNILNKE